MLAGDMHALAADDGTNTVGGITLFHAVAARQQRVDQVRAVLGGPYPSSGGTTVQQYGRVVVTDSGSSIALAFTGYDSTDTSHVTLTKTVTTASPPPPAGTVVDRWNGTALVRQLPQRWTGTVLADQAIQS